MRIQLPDGTWVQVPDTNSIAILNGEIDESRFHAEWGGQDTEHELGAAGQRSGI